MQSLAKKLKLLRLSHNLSYSALSNLFSLKSPTSISNIEGYRAFPSFELFHLMTDLFAVSPSWLMGYTDNVYDIDVISKIENKLFSETYQTASEDIPLLRKVSWIPEEYWNYELRTITYSIPVRANIIFLLHIYLATQRPVIYNYFANSEKIHITELKAHQRYLIFLFNTPQIDKKIKLFESYKVQLQNLLAAKESAKPIFDIQAQKTTEE